MRTAKGRVIFGILAVFFVLLLLFLNSETAPYEFLRGYRPVSTEAGGTMVYHIGADYETFRRIVAKELRSKGANKKIPTAWDTWILPDSELWVLNEIIDIEQGPSWEAQQYKTEPGMISVVIYRPAQPSIWEKIRAFLHI